MSRRPMIGVYLAGLLPLLGGCGPKFGALLYHMGVARTEKVKASFELSRESLLILVDDDQELVQWAPATDLLTNEVARNLQENKAAGYIFTSEEIDRVRNADDQFQQRSISEVGQQFGSDQILWVQLIDYQASREFEDASRVARITVRVKVFDPQAEVKAEMRLWPESMEGELVTIEKNAADIQKLNTEEDIARLLITELARTVAELFYEHTTEGLTP
ncbi:MAG: hypothetical protein HJJLKODD_00510 [Phycisphaerae bacterium]|nr:hypothetical protein [Phycisphaerae bacterium]